MVWITISDSTDRFHLAEVGTDGHRIRSRKSHRTWQSITIRECSFRSMKCGRELVHYDGRQEGNTGRCLLESPNGYGVRKELKHFISTQLIIAGYQIYS